VERPGHDPGLPYSHYGVLPLHHRPGSFLLVWGLLFRYRYAPRTTGTHLPWGRCVRGIFPPFPAGLSTFTILRLCAPAPVENDRGCGYSPAPTRAHQHTGSIGTRWSTPPPSRAVLGFLLGTSVPWRVDR